MTGQYQHTIDAKGRLFIPAKLREELGDTFYVTISDEACLTVYSEERWEQFRKQFDEAPYSQARAMRVLFALAAKCEPDAQGRILLPQKLRALKHLEKDVTVVGVGSHAEIWSTDAWNELESAELDPEKLGAAMKALGF